MNKCSIIIGSMWGDEGKGHITDILSQENNTLNVRFSGGAQASHTVVTPNGNRHAFRSFGSGTFLGAKTYLSRYYIINLPEYVLERKKLEESFGLNPKVIVNPHALVTTFWDVYINQAVETLRGMSRHGSCGFGINETVERSKKLSYQITVSDLIFRTNLKKKLKIIQEEYVQKRLKEEYNLTLKDLPEKYQALITDEENIDMFMFYSNEFLKTIEIEENSIISAFDSVVFEGSQGLMLDKDNEEGFPNVTSSSTGIKNALEILEDINYTEKVDVYYVSRCYFTRHGAGKLKNELKSIPYSGVEDRTNVFNEFQGSLRFSYLDFDMLLKSISKDLEHASEELKVNVVFTCLDQLPATMLYYYKSVKNEVYSCDFIKRACEILKRELPSFNSLYYTYGLTRNEFNEYKEKVTAYA
ncbi:MAG: adenylosuccinate synthetase [Clostridia bacterium]|nr:adenylosuccinate synthetase [Clostridia bacterium]